VEYDQMFTCKVAVMSYQSSRSRVEDKPYHSRSNTIQQSGLQLIRAPKALEHCEVSSLKFALRIWTHITSKREW